MNIQLDKDFDAMPVLFGRPSEHDDSDMYKRGTIYRTSPNDITNSWVLFKSVSFFFLFQLREIFSCERSPVLFIFCSTCYECLRDESASLQNSDRTFSKMIAITVNSKLLWSYTYLPIRSLEANAWDGITNNFLKRRVYPPLSPNEGMHGLQNLMVDTFKYNLHFSLTVQQNIQWVTLWWRELYKLYIG